MLTSTGEISLEFRQLERLFPFYMVLNRGLVIVSVSEQMKLATGYLMPCTFSDVFEVNIKPETGCDFEFLSKLDGNKICLRLKDKSPQFFSGTFETISQGNALLFVCEPTDADSYYGHGNGAKTTIENLDVFFRHITHNNADCILIADPNGYIEWANGAYLSHSGYTLEEIRGKKPRQFMGGPEAINLSIKYVDEQLKYQTPFEFESIGYTKSNQKFWFHSLVQPVFNSDSKFIGRVISLRDISERKAKEAAVLKSEELWRFALEGSSIGVWEVDYTTGIFTASTIFKMLIGYGPDEDISLQGLRALMHPEDALDFQQNILGNLSPENDQYNYEVRLRCKDGQYRYFFKRSQVLSFTDDGKPLKMVGTLVDINDKTQKDIAFRLHTEQLSSILSHLNEGILAEDELENVVLANQAFCLIFGFEDNAQSFFGNHVCDISARVLHLVHDKVGFQQMVIEAKDNHKALLGRIFELTNNKTISIDVIPVLIDTAFKGYIWKVQDITVSYDVQKETERVKQFYEKILNDIPADLVLFSRDHKYTFINKNAIKNNETREWMIGKTDFDYFILKGMGTQRAEARNKVFKAALRSKKMRQYVEENQTPDGVEYVLRVFAPMLDDGGEVQFIVGYGVDVTQQKLYERSLMEEREYYNLILNTLPVDVVVLDRDNKFKFINKKAIKNDELRQKLIGNDMYEYCRIKGIGTEIADRRHKFFYKAYDGREEFNVTEDFKLPDGNTQYVLRKLYPYINKSGDVEYVFVVGLDITEQILHQKNAELQENNVRNLLNVINDGVFRFHANGEITLYNQSFLDLMKIGGHAREKKEVNFFDLLTPKQLEAVKERIEVLQYIKAAQVGKMVVNEGSDNERHFEFNFSLPIANDLDTITGRITDITDIVNKEKNLELVIEKEKALNKTKTQFIRITSHELRTPLSIILSNAELLEMVSKNPDKVPPEMQSKLVNRIVREVNHMTEILNQLILVSKIEDGRIELEMHEYDINEFIANLIDDVYSPYKDGRTLAVEICKPNLKLVCDIRMLRYSIMNLLDNAFKYSPNKPAPILYISESETDVIFAVRDFGIGIPEEEMKNMFKSFFRASNVGVIQGTGIGLTIVDYAVSKHGGRIELKSVPNQETTFTIFIPKKLSA